VTSFAEGPAVRFPVPDDGKFHRVPNGSLAVRLHIFGARKGVIYVTSKSGAVAEGDPVATWLQNAMPLTAGAPYTLTFSDPTDVFVAADPDSNPGSAAPIVGVVQASMAVL
jgi:hypothetical protein